MHNEQVFTPTHIVEKILDSVGYCGNNIRKKHIIDNSCGNGAFLKEIVTIYIDYCVSCNIPTEEIKTELETYIHGIEIDKSLCDETIQSLDDISSSHGLNHINWDIINCDAMDVDCFNDKMDYVVGNPPYCKVHHLGDKFDKVKSYKFCQGGMTNLYLAFFEIGINMLNDNGKLGYITPNSWLNSTAGSNFRNYLKESKTLLEIYQYGYEKIFDDADTYTCITILSKHTNNNDNVFICHRNVENGDGSFEMYRSFENLEECMINDNIYLTDKNTLLLLKEIEEVNNQDKCNKNRIRVKNGFGTLNDKFFIIDEYEKVNEYNKNILLTTKASTGEKHYFFYPYDYNGKSMGIYDIDDGLMRYIVSKAFDYGIDTSLQGWYLYGRTQALNDVKYSKLIVNTIIKDVNDIKVELLDGTSGVYSGLYIPFESGFKYISHIREYIANEDFIKYIQAIGKYKSSGYYSFSSKDLENWINYCFHKEFH